MKKAELDLLIHQADKDGIDYWSDETRQAMRGLADQYEAERRQAMIEVGELPPEQPKASVSTTDAIDKFLTARQSGLSEGTKKSYRATLQVFAKFYPTLPTTPEEVEVYLATKSNRTAADAYAVIKLLYDFASQRLGVPNATSQVKRPRFKEKEPYSLTIAEAKSVLAACKDDRELGLIHLYLGHGWRLEEGCRTDIGDIGDGQILVKGKKRTEYTPLLSETREVFLKVANGREAREPLFSSQMGRRLSNKMAYVIVKTILHRAGVTEGKSPDLRIATHTLRKTFASLATAAGCDRTTVARLLRHRKRDVTDLYISMPIDILRMKLERYSPIMLLNSSNQKLDKTEY